MSKSSNRAKLACLKAIQRDRKQSKIKRRDLDEDYVLKETDIRGI